MPATTSASVRPEEVRPEQEASVLPAVSESEFIRASYLSTETSVKTLGAFFFLVSGFLTLSLVAYVIVFLVPGFEGKSVGEATINTALTLSFLIFPAALFHIGRQLLHLDPWSRKPAIILSIFGLFAFPIGTILNIGVLSFLFSKKVGFVLSDIHSLARHRTPHMRSRVSRTFIVFTIVVGLLIAVPAVFWLTGVVGGRG